jgi:hypothetical protein
VSRARALVGYAPRVGLVEGLGRLLAWYRQQSASPEDLIEEETLHNWTGAGRR